MDECYSGWFKLFREKFDAYMFIANTIKNEYSKITDQESRTKMRNILKDLAKKYQVENTYFESLPMWLGYYMYTAILTDIN